MSTFLQVATTTGSKAEAEAIARQLVEQHLAACVQISGPITSIYRWDGEIETGDEWLCTAKTLERVYPQVERTIRELHSYDEPQIVAMPIIAGSEGYLNWVRRECEQQA